MNSDYIVLLGVKGGPSVLPGGSMPTSTLVHMAGRNIVLDCGAGVIRGLTARGLKLQELETIIITHLHSDHYLELGPLIHSAWTCGLKHPIDVYGPSGLVDYWRGFLASMQFDIELREKDEGRPVLAKLLNIHEIATDGSGEPRLVFEEEGLAVWALRNNHPPIEESYSIRFQTDAHKLVFSGDTSPFDGFADFARNADLLVHEAMLASGVERIITRVGLGEKLRHHLYSSHTLAEDAAQIATDAGVRALALHHLIPCEDPQITHADWETAVRPHWSGPLHIGKDDMKITVGHDSNKENA